MRNSLLLVLSLTTIISCSNKKEQEIEQREKTLKIKEEQFAEKKADYESLLKLRDSLINENRTKDSVTVIKTWPDTLAAEWNSKMICKESSCSNYVIGDQRNETWQFLSDSLGIYTNVLNDKKLIRTFRANYKNDKIYLDFPTDSTSSASVKMQIVLDDIRKDVIKGTQIITRQNNCTSRFSVELTPSVKK